MNRWRVIPIPEAEALETDLTGAELIGISIMLVSDVDHADPDPWQGVYAQAWRKIQPQVHQAIEQEK